MSSPRSRLRRRPNLTVNTLRAGGQRKPTKEAHPVFALVWRFVGPRAVAASDRAALLAGLSGTVLELGAGDGASFPHYPDTVASVVAIEPEPNLRRRAASRAARSHVPVEVRDATAEALPVPDGSCDAVVACLVLCSVADQRRVLAEVRRVLRPGGELRFYEHVVSERPRIAGFQRFLDRSGLWPKLGAGCHLSRDTAAVMEESGFTINERWPLGTGGLRIVAGVARP